jgi:hypothetical protein
MSAALHYRVFAVIARLTRRWTLGWLNLAISSTHELASFPSPTLDRARRTVFVARNEARRSKIGWRIGVMLVGFAVLTIGGS